jgi:Tfp pilus assembly protein PilF
MIRIRGIGVAVVLATLLVSVGCASEPSRVGSVGPARSLSLPPAEGAEANVAVAEQFDKAGQTREAIRHYELARDLDPKHDQWVARRLGVLYDRLGDAYRAETEYDKAYKLSPNDAALLNDMGYFYYSYGRFEEAEKTLRKALEIKPDFSRAWINLGLTLGAQEHYQEAYEAFVKAVTPAESRANVALVMAHNGDYAEAEDEMRRAINQQPDLQRFNAVLEAIRRERGEEPSAGSAGGAGSK